MKKKPKGWFVVILLQPGMTEDDHPLFVTDEDGDAMRFETAADARRAMRGRLWEHHWVWWIAELWNRGTVVYGPDVKVD